MTTERNQPLGQKETGVASEFGWLSLKRFPSQSIYIFTHKGRIEVKLISLNSPDGPEIKFGFTAYKGSEKNPDEVIGHGDNNRKISISVTVDEDNPNRALVRIGAPRDYKILRSELIDRDRRRAK